MPLSKDKTIKNGRTLCKFLTGRTSSTVRASINKALVGFSPRFRVVLLRCHKKEGPSPASAEFGVEHVTPPPRGGGRAETSLLVFPCSPLQVVELIIRMDEQAETQHDIRYGVQAPTR